MFPICNQDIIIKPALDLKQRKQLHGHNLIRFKSEMTLENLEQQNRKCPQSKFFRFSDT